MKNDSDNIRNLLLWLLHNFHPTFSFPSGNDLHTLEASATKAVKSEVGSDATSMKPAPPQGSIRLSSKKIAVTHLQFLALCHKARYV